MIAVRWVGVDAWERFDGLKDHVAYVTDTGVTVNAHSCSHGEFLRGTLHDVVARYLGDSVVHAMLEAVRRRTFAASAHSAHSG